MKTLKEYIIELLAEGKYFFTKQETLLVLNINESQFRFQAYRLSQKKAIKKIVNNFYMIIPSEYSHLGSLPTNWIIDPLMKYLDQEYYIGLLSAAALYGSTEQQPRVFQVITDKTTKDIDLERTKIKFHTFKYCYLSTKTVLTVPTGYVKVSKREQTIVDLVRFYNVSGYLSNVALVIKSLAEESDPEVLSHVIANEKTKAVLQRLGYIFEITNFTELAKIVEVELSKRKIEYVLLRPDFHEKKGKKTGRWKLILNDSLELE